MIQAAPFARVKLLAVAISAVVRDIACATPGDLAVRLGEPVKFVAKHSGKEKHQMLIGTLRDLKEHAESAETDADAAHDASYDARRVGQDRSHRQAFTRLGIFYYGCHVPGVPGPGVIGRITVSR